MNGSVAPSLVEETAILVQGLEEIGIGLGTQPVQATNLEVGPLFPCVSDIGRLSLAWIFYLQNGSGYRIPHRRR